MLCIVKGFIHGVIVCLLGLYLLQERSWATHVMDRSLSELAATADVVANARIMTVHSRPSTANPKRYETVVRIRYHNVLWHDRSNQQPVEETLILPGGVVGRYAQKVSGVPQFVVGQEVVLLLVRHPALGHLMPMGLSMGHYRVDRDSYKVPMAISDQRGLTRMKRMRNGRWEKSDQSGVIRTPLDQLWKALQREVRSR